MCECTHFLFIVLHIPIIPFFSSIGRSSGSGSMFGGGSRSSATPSRSAAPSKAESRPSSNVPATVPHSTASVPAVASTGARPGGLMGTIMEGMAFGTGSAIAHRAVGAIAGSFGGGAAATQTTDNNQAQQQSTNGNVNYASQGQDCATFQQEFVRCLQENKNDIASCQMFMDNFTQCQKDNRLV